MEQSAEISELAKALCKVQQQLKPAKKGSENPFFKSSYADLSEVWDAAREPLTSHGLSVSQTMDGMNGTLCVVTTLMHESGQWLRGRLPINPVKNDPQSIGSAITYGRRYSLSAIIGLVTEEDDDGEGAMDRQRNGKVSKPEPPKQQVQKRQEREPVLEDMWEPEPRTTTNMKFLKHMGDLKKQLADDTVYYMLLGTYGVEHCNQIMEHDKQVEVYGKLKDEIERRKKAA